MTIDIVALGGVAAAILAIGALLVGAYRFAKKYVVGKTEESHKQIMGELSIIFTCFMAVFNGFEQLECNGEVTEAKEELTRHLNEQAHK